MSIAHRSSQTRGLLVDDGSATPLAIIGKNIRTVDGVVHIIDTVLTPPK